MSYRSRRKLPVLKTPPSLPPAPKMKSGLGSIFAGLAAGIGIAAAQAGLLGREAEAMMSKSLIPSPKFRSPVDARSVEDGLPAGRVYIHELSVTRFGVEVPPSEILMQVVLAGFDPERGMAEKAENSRSVTVASWVADAAKAWAEGTTDISWAEFVRAWKAGSR